MKNFTFSNLRKSKIRRRVNYIKKNFINFSKKIGVSFFKISSKNYNEKGKNLSFSSFVKFDLIKKYKRGKKVILSKKYQKEAKPYRYFFTKVYFNKNFYLLSYVNLINLVGGFVRLNFIY